MKSKTGGKRQKKSKRPVSRGHENPNSALTRYMVQIERAGSKLDKADIKEILSQTGFNLDPEYGPFLVNPMLGRYVVRGTATPESEF